MNISITALKAEMIQLELMMLDEDAFGETAASRRYAEIEAILEKQRGR